MKMTSDNKIIYILGELGRLVLVNILVILASLPIVTAGAALAAGYACLTKKEDPSSEVVVLEFLRAFRGSLSAGVRVWLLLLAGYVLALGDLFYAVAVAESTSWFFLSFSLFCLVLLSGISVWAFLLIARYENTVGGYLKNAFLLAFGRLPATLAVWALMLAFLLPLCFEGFVRGFGWLYPLCGVSGFLYLSGRMLERSVNRKESIWRQLR